MKKENLLGGLAAAVAVTIIHETLRRFVDDAPRMDKLGEEALTKGLDKLDQDAPKGKKLYWTTLIGDVVSNALYYSLTGKKWNWARGIGLGLAAGVGAVELPGPMGLSEKWSKGSNQKQLLTIGLYLLGGAIAAAVTSAMGPKKKEGSGIPAWPRA